MPQGQYLLTVEDSKGKQKKILWKDSGESLTQADVDNTPEYNEPTNKSKGFVDSEIDTIKDNWNKFKGFSGGLIAPLANAFEGVSKTGKDISDKIRAGDFPGAFEAATNPLMAPIRAVSQYALTGEKPKLDTKSAIEMTGIPASKIVENYKSGNKPALAGNLIGTAAMLAPGLMGNKGLKGDLIDPAYVESQLNAPEMGPHTQEFLQRNNPIVGPHELKPFEGLTGLPKEPPPAWNKGAYANFPYDQSLPLEYDEPIQAQLPLRANPRTSNMLNALAPESEAFDSIIPDRFKTDTTIPREPTNILPKQPELFDPTSSDSSNWMSQTIEPSPNEPRIFDLNRPSWAAYAQQRGLPFDTPTIESFENSGSPELAKAAKQLVDKGVEFSRKSGYTGGNKTGDLRHVIDDMTKSNMTVLERDSPAGAAIGKLVSKYRIEAGQISGQISDALKAVVNPLDKAQYSEFQQLLDRGGNSNDSMINNALNTARTIDKEISARATASGMGFKTSGGETIPFTPRENYFPRIYDPSLFKDKPALIERLIKQGLSPEAAKKAIENSRRFGERLIDPQHSRELDLPEHRKDLGALLKHYDDMAFRIAGSEIFGPKDIADPNSPISNLIKQTKDTGRVTKIMTQYLDRDAGVAPYDSNVASKLARASTYYYLSRFALTNSNQLSMIPLVTNFKSSAKAFRDFALSPKESWRRAERSGALQTVLEESLRNVGGESLASKAFGIKASEGLNRTISVIAGQHYATDLFNELKNSPNNTRLRNTLQDLTFEHPDRLLQQDSLSAKQLDYAGSRVSELAQGRAQSIDLPYKWDKSPWTNVWLMYKKYSFVQNKLIKNALKADPSKSLGIDNINMKNAAVLLPIFLATGEVTGDMKAAVKGLFPSIFGNQQDVKNRGMSAQIANRGQYLGMENIAGKNVGPILNRLIQNANDAWFLGLIGDVANSVRGGKQSMYNTAFGPVFSLPIETAGNIGADITNRKVVKKNPSKSQFLRQLGSHIPYVGSSILESMK